MVSSNPPGISALAREVAMSLAHLLGQHAKIAQLELTEELHTMGRRATVVAVLVTLIALGYGMAMIALALIIGGKLAVGIPLVIIGLAHMAGGGAGLVLSRVARRGSGVLDNSKAAMDSSLAVLDKVTAAPVPPIVEKPHGE